MVMNRSRGLPNIHLWTVGAGGWVPEQGATGDGRWEKALESGRMGFESWLQFPCLVTLCKSLQRLSLLLP